MLLTGGLLVGIGTVLFSRFIDTPLETQQHVLIERGWNSSQIANALESQGVVTSARLFLLMAYLHEPKNLKLHAGEYQFEPGQTPPMVLDRLEKGDVVRYKFTFPEGLTVAEIVARMQEQGWKDAQPLSKDLDLLKKTGLAAPSLEGWLFPETYFYIRGDSALDMVMRMTRMTKKILDQEWSNRDTKINLTPLEALTLASIIEKETGKASERKRISGVFHNRLKRHMRLESDPTVIYGLAEFNGNITRQDLITATPFNTYTNFGLPPTPICNPGHASIHAALHPDQTEELFFVAKGDGSHLFSKSYEEHKINVNRYQKGQKTNFKPGKHDP